MDVLLYARLSVSKDESVSIARQLEAARQYAAARGWNVVGEFADDGVSASKVKPEHRPAWRDLLAAAEASKPHAVIVWKVDRLARRVLDFLNADDALQRFGAGLVAVEDPIDMTTPQGRAFATVLAVFAELEAASIASRVKDARRALLAAGRRGGGRPPFGWMNVPNPDGPGYVLAQDPERIAYVGELVERGVRGESIYSMAKWLDAQQVPRRERGNRGRGTWSEGVVEAVLRNPVVAGMTRYQPGRKPGEPADSWAVVRDADGVPVVDESVALVSVEEWRRLLSVLDANKRPGSRPKAALRPSMLSGLLRCEGCGKNLHRSRVANRYEYYRCGNRECSAQVGVSQLKIEAYIAARVLEERGEDYRFEFDHIADGDRAASDLAAIEQALEETGSALVATRDAAERVRLLKRLDTLQQRQADAEKSCRVKPVVSIKGGVTWGRDFRAALDAGDVPEQQRLLREVVEFVTIKWAGKGGVHSKIEHRVEVEWLPLPEEEPQSAA